MLLNNTPQEQLMRLISDGMDYESAYEAVVDAYYEIYGQIPGEFIAWFKGHHGESDNG